MGKHVCVCARLQYKEFKNNKQDFNFFIQLPLQSAVQREIARWQLNQVQ